VRLASVPCGSNLPFGNPHRFLFRSPGGYLSACSTIPTGSTPPPPMVETLSFALRYDGLRRVHHSDDIMAQITAERSAAHLEQCGFVVMKKPAVRLAFFTPCTSCSTEAPQGG